MHYLSIFALLAALFFPAPAARLATSDAAQVITLSPVEHVRAATAPGTTPHRAVATRTTAAIASTPTSHTTATSQLAAAGTAEAKPTVAVAPAPSQTAAKSSSAAFSAVELAVIADINAARATEGLSTLTADAELGTIARAHSADMLANNYFEHTSPSGCSAVCRYQNAGYSYWSMGENIYWMEGFSLTDSAAAQKVVDAWQNSPGHRDNDLGKFTRMGVGVAQSGSKVYVTADFATPR